MEKNNQNLKSIFIALFANTLIAIAKFIAAFITGSGSMMAEAIHSSSDCINQILLLVGIKRSKRPPNDDFPLGYGKELYFYSFIVSILIFSIGGLFSLYEGFHKLHSTEAISSPMIAITVLIFAIFMEGFAFFGCLKQVKQIKGKKSYLTWIQETRKTELVIILGEDFAALIGLVLALVAISISVITNNPIYDALGSITIGVLLIIVAFFLSKIIKDLLIGRGAEKKEKEAYINLMKDCGGIVDVLNLVSMSMGEDILLAFKVKMDSNLTTTELVDSINNAEKKLKQSFPEINWLFVEPDSIK